MIPDPDTLKRIRAQAEAYAASITDGTTDRAFAELVEQLLVRAYLAGADAGYSARAAEERKP